MKKKFNLSVDNLIRNNKDNMIQKKENTAEILKEEQDNCSSCSFDSVSSQIPFSTKSMVEKSDLEKLELQEEIQRKEHRQAKILIIIGITLTVPLITIELLEFYDIIKNSIIVEYVLLALATPIQILLGKPFYKRLYYSVKNKRSFTVDMLVVLRAYPKIR